MAEMLDEDRAATVCRQHDSVLEPSACAELIEAVPNASLP